MQVRPMWSQWLYNKADPCEGATGRSARYCLKKKKGPFLAVSPGLFELPLVLFGLPLVLLSSAIAAFNVYACATTEPIKGL